MNLIIDGHAYLNVISPVALYILRNNTTEDEIFDENENLTEEAKDFFRGFFLTFLSNIMLPYKNVLTHVYIVLDNDSWRKYYTNKFCNRNPQLDPFEYKGNRKKTKEKKTKTFKLFNLFIDQITPDLSELDGITILSVRGAEGDDLIAYLSDKLNDHNIIWSGDMDLTQLLKREDKVTFMVTPKRPKKDVKNVYIPINKDVGLNLSNNMLEFNNIISFFQSKREYDVIESDFNIEFLVKIIHGDRGDNIQSAYHYLSPNGRRMNVSENQARYIISNLISKYKPDDFIELIDNFDEAFLNDIVDEVFINKNLKKKNDERK